MKTNTLYSKPLAESSFMDGRDLFGGKSDLTGKSYIFNEALFPRMYGDTRLVVNNSIVVGAMHVGEVLFLDGTPDVMWLRQMLKRRYNINKCTKKLLQACKPIMIQSLGQASEDWCILEFENRSSEIYVLLFGYSMLNGWVCYDVLPANIACNEVFITDDGFEPNGEARDGMKVMLERSLNDYLASKGQK